MAMLSAAYIHTIKTSVPIFVVATSCFLGKRYSFKTYIALLVILSGVMIASKTEMSLTSEGLIISLSSAMGTAVFSIYMKMVLTSSSLHASDIMFVVASTSVFCIFPVWAFVDLRRMICTDGTQLLTQFKKVAYLLFLDGVARCLQNLVAIVMLSHLTALGYSVASVMKRFVVILTAIVFFATPVSGMTFFGLGLAMTGLLLYNLSKDGQSSDPSQNSELEQTDENVSMKRVRIDAFSKNHQPIRNLA
ncbi:solute carrier family 35 member e1 protein [Echinococcus multilocularis]|uniref:Solute carrier family 35 member e1 protein n=1 Tax=Echinococcus multilocularis TaxID=6211 RepID=A0A087W0D2_ECHMU|nr:solute carrier family 35 member e1 protein [Echinococcus multilocularis]